MSSFEDLGLGPELVEALAAEGIERPSSLQEEAVPVLRRGNNLVARAGPGAGVLVAYGAPLLDRLPVRDGDSEGPEAVVLVPTRERATALARSLGFLGKATGRRVAGLGGPWRTASRAELLFATPGDLLGAVRDSRIKLQSVAGLVVDGAGAIDRLEGFDAAETLAGLVPSEAQKAVFSLPLPETLESFVEGHIKRAVRLPPGGGDGDDVEAPRRGTLGIQTVDGERDEAVLEAVAHLLDAEGIEHVLVHFCSEYEAADVGDLLSLHGFEAGAAGEDDVPVWLGTDDGESRRLVDDREHPERVATLSYRVPMDADALDRRHGRGGPAATLLRARELPHLQRAAAVAGYSLTPVATADRSLAREVEAFRERIRDAAESGDLAAYHLLLEPLHRRYGSLRVSAAAAALLRARSAPPAEAAAAADRPSPDEAKPAERGWVRLFMSLGRRDDAGPGDILGAITGEARIDGSRVGRIDIRDTFSLVEVDPGVAETVIEAMNGITVKGRSIRVDFDRERGRGGRGGGGGSRRGGGSRERGGRRSRGSPDRD